MSTTTAKTAIIGWAILELMGHRRLAGHVTEQEIAGTGFIRIDVPGRDDEPVATQFYAPASVYCLTPTTEAMARAIAIRDQPAPVQRWELALPAPRPEPEDDDASHDEMGPPCHCQWEIGDGPCPRHGDTECQACGAVYLASAGHECPTTSPQVAVVRFAKPPG